MKKLKVVYSKSKEAVFLSHMDVARILKQALNRAEISVQTVSENKKQLDISFASPLAVGIESTAEIAEIVLSEFVEIPYFIKQMNNVLPDGITVLSAEYIPLLGESISSRVYAATYLITIIYTDDMLKDKTKKEIEDLKNKYRKNMQKYLEQRSILVLKKSNDRMERIDIKTKILNYEFTLDGSLEITVSLSNKNNLKPDFVMSGYLEYIDEQLEYEIKRTKILYW